MRTKPSLNVTACWQHAAQCELEATRASDLIARGFFLDIADRWYRIANTFAYLEQRTPKPIKFWRAHPGLSDPCHARCPDLPKVV